MPGVEALACCRPAEGDDVPVEQPGVAVQLDASVQLGLSRGIDDGLLRQPFQRGTGLDAQLQVLKGRAGGAIPLAAPGLVSCAQAPGPSVTLMSSRSPPAMPPG